MLGVYNNQQGNTGSSNHMSAMRFSDDSDFIELRPFHVPNSVSNKEGQARCTLCKLYVFYTCIHPTWPESCGPKLYLKHHIFVFCCT